MEGVPSTKLSVSLHICRGRTVLIPTGEIDMESAGVLSDALALCNGTVIVDLAGVPFVGSDGFAVLIAHRRRLAASGGTLVLRNPRELTRRAFEVVGLSEWLGQP